jgi:cytidylate kinase
MPVTVLTPAVEQRMKAFQAMSLRAKSLAADAPPKPTITLTREFGCEAFPVAEELLKLCEKRSGEQWVLVDKTLLDAVAREHNISEEIFHSLGQKPRWFDEMLATLSPNWKTETAYYQLLCKEVVSIAMAGNAIIVGMGAPIITLLLKNCFHFRLFAEREFKARSIARRLNIPKQDAEFMIEEKQKERDSIIGKLLDADENNPFYYHMIFNNGKVRSHQIAKVINDFVLK